MYVTKNRMDCKESIRTISGRSTDWCTDYLNLPKAQSFSGRIKAGWSFQTRAHTVAGAVHAKLRVEEPATSHVSRLTAQPEEAVRAPESEQNFRASWNGLS